MLWGIPTWQHLHAVFGREDANVCHCTSSRRHWDPHSPPVGRITCWQRVCRWMPFSFTCIWNNHRGFNDHCLEKRPMLSWNRAGESTGTPFSHMHCYFFCIASDKPVRADVTWSLTPGLQVKASHPHTTWGGMVVLQQISLLRMQHKTYSALMWPNSPWQLPCWNLKTAFCVRIMVLQLMCHFSVKSWHQPWLNSSLEAAVCSSVTAPSPAKSRSSRQCVSSSHLPFRDLFVFSVWLTHCFQARKLK